MITQMVTNHRSTHLLLELREYVKQKKTEGWGEATIFDSIIEIAKELNQDFNLGKCSKAMTHSQNKSS